MSFKKTIAGISAMLIAAAPLAAPMTTFAADTTPETTEQTFIEGKITEYVYALDNTDEIQCRFYTEKPNIPYVKLSDFYKTLNEGKELSITQYEKEGKVQEGTFALETTFGSKSVIDANKDVLYTGDYICFSNYPEKESDPNADTQNIFWKVVEVEDGEDFQGSVFDFGSYDIDLIAEDNDIWFPLGTLCNTFNGTIQHAIYLGGSLYYLSDESDFNIYSFLTDEVKAEFLESLGESRPEDLVKYNYNEMCRVIDTYYGFPGRIPLNDILSEKGFDGMLSEANDDTRHVKEQLLSTDYEEYIAGMLALECYLWDGGHTVMFSTGSNVFSEEMINNSYQYTNENLDYDGASNIKDFYSDYLASYHGVSSARTAVLGENEEDAIYRYVKKGDTALFSFDTFMDLDTEGWGAYYNKDGAMPTDIISAFKECLDDAEKDENIKNFIVDVSLNGGGYTNIPPYMISMMGGVNEEHISYVKTGIDNITENLFDKNFDKVFDDKDNEVKYDLNFGLITSVVSFSSANIFPTLARDSGFMIIGEQSGGGSCNVENYITPDGCMFSMSCERRYANKNGENVDAGIKPDYELVTINEDGTKDFSKVFDFDVISQCFADFYGKNNNDEPVTTTSTTSKPAESTTTTTTAVTETTTSSSSSETTSSTTSSSTTASSTTTSTTTAEVSSTTTQSTDASSSTTTTQATGKLPDTGNNSLITVIVTFTAISLTAGGAVLLTANRKKEDE